MTKKILKALKELAKTKLVKVDLKKMEGMEEEELKTYFMKCCESVEEEKEEDIPDAVSDLYNEERKRSGRGRGRRRSTRSR
jgi:dihydroxyacetone kinase DhaKLM complex PTS-EIIA-like component DhaM